MEQFFSKFDGVYAVTSDMSDGNMKINFDRARGISTNENRKKFFERIAVPENKVVSALLDHGNYIEVINESSPKFIPKIDALVTTRPRIPLAITNADCYPIFFFDPTLNIVGIAHVGYPGLVNGIIPNLISEFQRFGSASGDIQVAIGPGICQECYEFGPEAHVTFKGYEKYVRKQGAGKFKVDLRGIILKQLRKQGIKSGNIEDSGKCTSCNQTEFFSARRDKKRPIDAMASLIMLK